MSLFRTSWLLLTARIPLVSAVNVPVAIRHKTTSTDTASKEAAIILNRTPAAPHAYTNAILEAESEAPSDAVTSAYSPITSLPEERGPEDPLGANFVSGAPLELQSRTVHIYKPTKPATQSGNWNGRQWRMDWDVLSRGHRWENPLMGWQSSGDFMQGTHIFFKTKEDAVNFAEKQGYNWFVQEPNIREFRSKAYATNFMHSSKKLKIIRTK